MSIGPPMSSGRITELVSCIHGAIGPSNAKAFAALAEASRHAKLSQPGKQRGISFAWQSLRCINHHNSKILIGQAARNCGAGTGGNGSVHRFYSIFSLTLPAGIAQTEVSDISRSTKSRSLPNKKESGQTQKARLFNQPQSYESSLKTKHGHNL